MKTTTSRSAFLKRFQYHLNYLIERKESLIKKYSIQVVDYPEFCIHVDWTINTSSGALAKFDKRTLDVHQKLVPYLLESTGTFEFVRSRLSALPEMHRVLEAEEMAMDPAYVLRIPVLAARLAGYADLSENTIRELSADSALFKKIKEEIQW